MHAHTRPIPKATDPRPPPSSPSPRRARGHWQQTIAGRVCAIDTRQLMLVWWLHTQGHLTRRQLRVWFALHEMLGRRLAGEAGKTAKVQKGDGGGQVRRPSYGLEELRKLLGTDASDKALRADLATLDRLGVATMTERTITLAPSTEQVTLPTSSAVDGDPWADYHALLDRIPAANRRRTIPIPRRTLRALAAGFSRGTTAVMLAMLIRCLFRHGSQGSGQKGDGGEKDQAGRYRIDGRTKGSWIAQTFGVSRRAVTEGRARLIELGWLTPLDCSQIELNRWGTHDRINPDWTPPPPSSPLPANLPAPRPRSAPGSASPKKNQNPSIENLNQNPRTRRADRPPGPCGKGRGVKPTAPSAKSNTPPRLRDIRPQDLRDNDRLLALLDQAAAAGQWGTSEADRLDFFALAERARAQANNPPAMFRWLIQHHKRTHIAQSDEDRAMSRLRELRNGPGHDRDSHRPSRSRSEPSAPTLTETDRLVRTCLQVARDRRLDPYRIASQLRPDWTRTQWDDARMAYEHAELQRRHFLMAEAYYLNG
ncbi:MAG: hypothetical protein AAF663_01165 [Planctomycetota bacterium]